MTEFEKMKQGLPYKATDPELIGLQLRCKSLVAEYNQSLPTQGELRAALLKKLLGTCSEATFIEPSLRCDFGFNIHFEGMGFVNYNCVMLDTAPIRFGPNVMVGPNCCFACPSHPLVAEERNTATEYAKPITVGANVWFGAGCTVLGGVKIGDNSVIGAGSLVNRDIPEGMVAAGVPCRVIRHITDADKML